MHVPGVVLEEALHLAAMRARALSLPRTGSFVVSAESHNPILPSAVTYSLGGVVSGPYHLTVDLEHLSEVKFPPGIHSGGARVSAATLPETAGRALTPAERRALLCAANSGKDCP